MKACSFRHTLVLSLLLFGLILSSDSSAQQPIIEQPYTAASAGAEKAGGWDKTLSTQAGTPFSSKEGRFSITLPPDFPAFRYTKETQPTKVGNIDLHMHNSGVSNAACVLAYSDYPSVSFEGRSDQKILDDGRDGGLASVKGTLEKQESTTVQGFPGITVYLTTTTSDDKKLYVRFEYVLVKPRMYQIGYLSYDRAALDKPETHAFFKSFHLEV